MGTHWPSPDSLYKTFTVRKDDERVCEADCSARHCLANMCVESYFDEIHFPLLRPLAYSSRRSDFQVSADLGYVIDLFFQKIDII